MPKTLAELQNKHKKFTNGHKTFTSSEMEVASPPFLRERIPPCYYIAQSLFVLTPCFFISLTTCYRVHRRCTSCCTTK
jgi:hypothetical protein